ncbi:hypothetical protein F1880_001358 [Penicillium rolfsii]|nr:hypothetical protein F1880_001358 [Penicillium rolfsii]
MGVLSVNTLHPFHLDLATNFFFAKMVLPVPELGDFITFPAAPTNSVTIGWYQTKWTWREEEYYCAPCFTRGKDTTDFDIGYPTIIFIAREWADRLYYNAPGWAGLKGSHILSFFGAKVPSDVSDKWIETKISPEFFYGQDTKTDPKFRWIVYHPADRNPAQGRFVKNGTQRAVSDLIGATPAINISSIGTVAFDAETAKRVNSWGVRVLGHKLHQFGHQQTVNYELSDADIEEICQSITNNLLAKLKDDSVQIDPAPKLVAPMVVGAVQGSKANPQPTSSPTVPGKQVRGAKVMTNAEKTDSTTTTKPVGTKKT